MNKLIVITGGTKGIGKALIEKFAKEGFDIVTCSRHVKDLELCKKEITSRYSVNFYYKQANLANKEEVLLFADYVASLEQPVDILVNNTGIFVPGQVHTEDDGVLENMIQTNLYSAYHLTRALIPAMKTRKNGYIFNMCSTASITPYINGGSYCVTKFALLGMTKVLREEMKDFGIKVTAVIPGATLTASWEGTDLPPERFMKPEDVAAAVWVAFSLSPQAVLEEMIIRPQLGDL